MTTEQNPSPASEPQGPMSAAPQGAAPQAASQQGQTASQGQGGSQAQGHRRRRRRRNKGGPGGKPHPGTAAINGQAGGNDAAAPQNTAPAQAPRQAPQHQNSGQGSANHGSGQGSSKQKGGKRFFQKSPGNGQGGGFNGNGFGRPSSGNQNGSNGNGNGARRKSKGRRQQVFVGPMDHSYRGGANGNVADPVTHSSNGDFRGMPHSGFYSEVDYYQPVAIREDAPTRIYCFIEDLFLAAKIQEVSRKLGIKVSFLKPDKDVVAKLADTDEENRPALIMVDLNNLNAKPLTLIPKIKTKLKRGTSIIGFLSQIQGDLKSKAIEAGCDTVMPRATFSQNLPNLLRRYGSEEEEQDQVETLEA